MRELQATYSESLMRFNRDELLHNVMKNGYALFRGTELSSADFVSVAKKVGEPIRTGIGTLEDGLVIDLHDDPGNKNPAFSKQGLVLHSDLIFYHELPKYFSLHCVQPADKGGETFLLDGEEAARILLGTYGGLRDVVLSYQVEHPDSTRIRERPLIGSNCGKDVLIFRDVTPGYENERIELVDGTPDELDDILQRTRTVTQDETLLLRTSWRKGDTLIVDNIRMLHGREPYEGDRRLLRINMS